MKAAYNKKEFVIYTIKNIILLFWGIWFFLTFASNIGDLINALNFSKEHPGYRSGNYSLILSAIQTHGLSVSVAMFLFICDIILQGAASTLFIISSVTFCRNKESWFWINLAFAFSITMWASFMIMDEFFLAYSLEETHMAFFTITMVTFLAVHLLPDSSKH